MSGPVIASGLGRAEATRLFVDIAPLDMVLIDLDSRIVALSPSAAAAIGEAPGAIVGRSLVDVYGGVEAALHDMREASARGEAEPAVVRHIRLRAGDGGWLRARSSWWRGDDGELFGVLLVNERTTPPTEDRDVREQAAATAVALAHEARAEFLAHISHGIRTPLNGVLGMAQAMARGDLLPAQRDRLEVIRRSGDTLLSLLNDALDLSTIETGKLEIEWRDFDLEETVRDACGAVEALAARKGLAFRLAIEGEAGHRRGDAKRLRQIIANLVGNALKFTRAGTIDVSVRADAETVDIQVADTGVGMASDVVETLFHRFAPTGGAARLRFAGTGLGLAICRELCELMGGRILAESAPGLGSRFIVSLPLALVGRAAAPANDQDTVCASLRVLAVEDNEINRLVLRAVLEQAGVEVTIVENGAEAIDAWAAGGWDAILMDVQMPVMDGQTATAEIRRREQGAEAFRTPIIAVTANAMAHQVAEYLAGGMDAVVAKPIEIKALLETLARVVADEAPVAARG